jgi:hypothetical protein
MSTSTPKKNITNAGAPNKPKKIKFGVKNNHNMNIIAENILIMFQILNVKFL